MKRGKDNPISKRGGLKLKTDMKMGMKKGRGKRY